MKGTITHFDGEAAAVSVSLPHEPLNASERLKLLFGVTRRKDVPVVLSIPSLQIVTWYQHGRRYERRTLVTLDDPWERTVDVGVTSTEVLKVELPPEIPSTIGPVDVRIDMDLDTMMGSRSVSAFLDVDVDERFAAVLGTVTELGFTVQDISLVADRTETTRNFVHRIEYERNDSDTSQIDQVILFVSSTSNGLDVALAVDSEVSNRTFGPETCAVQASVDANDREMIKGRIRTLINSIS